MNEQRPSTADDQPEDSHPSSGMPRERPEIESPPPASPRQRIKIGTQREQPAAPAEEPAAEQSETLSTLESVAEVTDEPVSEFPPPRIETVSDDLQAEIDEALGDVSLDELMAAEASGTGLGEQLAPESRCRGTVIKVHRDSVFLSLVEGYEGVASLKQFHEPPAAGTQLDVIVTGYSADEGLYEVAVPGAAVNVEDWSDLTEGVVVEARVTGHNKGGLECEVNRLRGFIPASQVSLYRVDDLSQFVDQKLPCVVTEANPQRRNLVLSHRAVLERERQEASEKLLSELEVGQVREGVVTSIQDFGAFVDVGGIDGLVHVSQLSWDRVGHPSDVLEVGQQVKVKVEKIDRESGKLGLSYRELLERPWDSAAVKFPVGAIVQGNVTKIADFGAFVRVAPGIEGLVHISELDHRRVNRVSQVVSEGQEVTVKVLTVDQDAQRMSLSIKAVKSVPASDASADDEDSADEDASSAVIPQPTRPLKGGVNRPSGGDQFGLKW